MKILVGIALALMATHASAATAFLQNCEFGTSVTMQPIYIGTYNYMGQVFQRYFPASIGWCPSTVEVS